MGDDELLAPRDVERLLGISSATLYRMRKDQVGPAPVDIGAEDARRPTFRWRRGDLTAWLKERNGE